MSLDFAPNDTTEREPRQEPYRRHEGWSVIAGTLPAIVDGYDGMGEPVDPAWPSIDDASLAAYEIACADLARRAAEQVTYVRAIRTRRLNAAEKAVA